jgi:hypothetical protein
MRRMASAESSPVFRGRPRGFPETPGPHDRRAAKLPGDRPRRLIAFSLFGSLFLASILPGLGAGWWLDLRAERSAPFGAPRPPRSVGGLLTRGGSPAYSLDTGSRPGVGSRS